MERQMADRPTLYAKHPQATARQEMAGRRESHTITGNPLGNC